MTFRTFFILVLVLISLPVLAADPTRDVRQGAGRNSAYAEIGLGLFTSKIPLVGLNESSIEESDENVVGLDFILEGRFQYKRVFAELVEDSFSNITLGYSVYDNDRGSFELIATNMFADLDYSDLEGLESLEDRSGDFNLGFRSSHFFNNTLLQLELVGDISDSHDGIIGAVHVGHQKQILNWNLFGLAGLRYFSDAVINHLLGVSAAEATEALPEYEGRTGVVPSLQLGATLPVAEKWTFNIKAEYAKFPDSVSDSPLAQGSDMYIGRIGFNYILFN